MKRASDILGIGELAKRTGLSVSAIRFYETKGLVKPIRNAGGQRQFRRSDIRRLSFVLIAQQLGLPLREIVSVLEHLPEGRTPNQNDWSKISHAIRDELDQRIAGLTRMRDRLDGCIGCGCLSLKNCELYNPDDLIAKHGAGPRYIVGDRYEPFAKN